VEGRGKQYIPTDQKGNRGGMKRGGGWGYAGCGINAKVVKIMSEIQ